MLRLVFIAVFFVFSQVSYSQITMWDLNQYKQFSKAKDKKMKQKKLGFTSKKRGFSGPKAKKSKHPFLSKKYSYLSPMKDENSFVFEA